MILRYLLYDTLRFFSTRCRSCTQTSGLSCTKTLTNNNDEEEDDGGFFFIIKMNFTFS